MKNIMEYSRLVTIFGIFAVIDTTMCLNKTFTYGPSIAAIPKVLVESDASSLQQGTFPFSAVSYEHRVELRDYPGMSVLIPIATNSYKASGQAIFLELLNAEHRNLRNHDSFGVTFTVVAPSGFQVMATVQTLSLFSEDFSCSDKQFLQFGPDNNQMKRVCGTVDLSDRNPNPPTLIGPRTYRSKDTKLSVTFRFADYSWLKDDPSSNTEFALSVSFTAFQTAHFLETDELLEVSGKFYYSCSSPSDLSYSSPYIDVNLFCDGVMNCGSLEDFGNDEDETLCDQVKIQLAQEQIRNSKNISSGRTEVSTDSTLPKNRRFGLGSLDSSYYYGQQDNTHPFFPYSPMPSNSNYNNNEDVFQSSLSPPTTILVIVFVIVVVMLVGTIMRFCCTKCVGTPVPIQSISSAQLDSNNLGITAIGENGLPTVFYQCSRVNISNDLPPSYEELFPSWKLTLNEGGGNVNPSFEGDISICPTRVTESTNATEVSSKNSSPNNV